MKTIKKDECSYSVSNAIRTLAMVRLEGFEPATFWFVAKHSIQLSYSRNSCLRVSPDDLLSIAQVKEFGKCFFQKN